MYNLNIKFMKKPNQKNDTDSDGVVMEPIHDVGNSGDDLDDSVVAEESQKDTIAKLREKIKQLEATKQEYLTGWQRDKADFINARKRDEADRREFMKFANEQLIFDIIPVLEHWDLAMSHKESWEKADKNWRVGVESIFNQLKKKGLSPLLLQIIQRIKFQYPFGIQVVGFLKKHFQIFLIHWKFLLL